MIDQKDQLIKELLLANLKEQRAKRRWQIFFKLSFLIVIVILLLTLFLPNNDKRHQPHTAIIKINGVIDATAQANADSIIKGLDAAFKAKETKGVILQINSPGGSAVQASQVYNEIFRLRQRYPKIKIYAVCTDICTSAAYYMASVTDKIYANPASLVGSIGVLIDSFGFVDTLNKLGISRRLFISGVHKGFLDPFSPLKPEDKIFVQTLLDQVHQQFIQAVLKGRGKRLKVNTQTFSGLAWTGQQALTQGLIDGYGSSASVARRVIKADALVNYSTKPDLLAKFSRQLGASFATRFGELLGIHQGVQA